MKLNWNFLRGGGGRVQIKNLLQGYGYLFFSPEEHNTILLTRACAWNSIILDSKLECFKSGVFFCPSKELCAVEPLPFKGAHLYMGGLTVYQYFTSL